MNSATWILLVIVRKLQLELSHAVPPSALITTVLRQYPLGDSLGVSVPGNTGVFVVTKLWVFHHGLAAGQL